MNRFYRIKIDNAELTEELAEIGNLVRELENKTAFLNAKSPALCIVPGEDNDCIRIGDFALIGASKLSESQKNAAKALLESFCSDMSEKHNMSEAHTYTKSNFINLLKERKVTQKELAEELGVHQTLISQWCCGKTTPTIRQVSSLSEFLKIPVEDIIKCFKK